MKDEVYLSWLREFSHLDLGDQRVSDRFLTVLNDFTSFPPASIYGSSQGEKSRMKAAYRLMSQEKLEAEKVWSEHQAQTMKRIREHRVVLIISDSTSFNFESHKNAKGLGRIGGNIGLQRESLGLHCHNILAVTPDNLPLGILDQQVFVRGRKERGRKVFTAQIPHLEKETSRWSLNLAKSVMGSEGLKTQLIAVSDRESDINAYIGTALDLGVEFVVRSKKARKEHKTYQYLNEFMSSKEVKGKFKLELIKRTQKTGYRRKPYERLKHAVYREVDVEVRWEQVHLQVENIFDESRVEPLTCLHIRETNAENKEEAIEWVLITSLSVTSLKKARQIIGYYSSRWIIEVFHKMLKTGGCDIEACCLQTRDRLERYITMESLVALKLTQLTYYQRVEPDTPCTFLVNDLTWKTAYCVTKKTKTLPEHPPTASELTNMIAKLGGYLNRNSDPYPGPIVLRRGWERLEGMKVVYEMFSH